MRKILCLITFCCLCLLTAEVLGGFWRRSPRIRVRRILKPVCSLVCKGACKVAANWINCPICVVGCPAACKSICKKRRKRREQTGLVMYPCSFSEYDTNKDGTISQEEFKRTLDFLTPEDHKRIFTTMDKNGDGLLDEEEFNAIVSTLNPTNCI